MSVVRADALTLPVADSSVDLIVTSPPYFALRSYQDGGEHYDGQIGSEPTPQAFLDALWAVTRECWRALKPSGSLFVNLGDKYSGVQPEAMRNGGLNRPRTDAANAAITGNGVRFGARSKSLLGLPWRYAIGCVDGLADPDGIGWILRAELVWSKPNGLPESVTDRVRRSHETWFHLVKSPRYYSSVDEIREEYAPSTQESFGRHGNGVERQSDVGRNRISVNVEYGGIRGGGNSLGKMPGSVWEIPTEPLTVPDHVGVDHFAAFPTEWPRRLILGWSPPAICTACGEGRRPTTTTTTREGVTTRTTVGTQAAGSGRAPSGHLVPGAESWKATVATITGYVCACTPYVDHPPSGTRATRYRETGGYLGKLTDLETGSAWREYLTDGWDAPPTRPAVVLDPFGGTGTVAMVANVLGRVSVSVDLSADYCRLAQWRINESDHDLKAVARTNGSKVAESIKDRREAARAGQTSLLDDLA